MLRAHARGGGRGTVNPLARKVVCGICGCTMEQTASGCAGKKQERRTATFAAALHSGIKHAVRGRTICRWSSCGVGTGADALHIAGHLKPEWFEAEQIKSEAEQCRQAKREELERLKAEIQRRRKAMQELRIWIKQRDRQLRAVCADEPCFLDEADRLEKRCVLLEDALARAANTPGQKKRWSIASMQPGK